MLPQEPAQPRDLGQAGSTSLQLCLWQWEGVGGGSDGSGTCCSALLAACATTGAHAAHAEAWLLPACQLRFPSHFGDGCLLLPAAAWPHLPPRFRGMGFSPPDTALCYHQPSLAFPQRLTPLGRG